jgi:putative DNA primase/helicase
VTDISFEETILRELGAAPAHVMPDGKIHRFAIGKHKDHGWYVYHDGKFPAGVFGDWGTGGEGHKWRFKNGATKLTTADRAIIKAQEAKTRAEIAKEYALAAKEASAIWEKASPANPDHPYLVKKKVGAHGIKQDARRLIVPVFIDEKITSVQTIGADGFKLFLKGGRTGGGSYPIGEIGGEVIIGEGYATVAALHELFQTPVITAFSAHNLLAVAKATRAKYPDARTTLAADDDFKTECDKGSNPGICDARAAARAIGAEVAIPPFDRSRGDTGKDWNDYAAA